LAEIEKISRAGIPFAGLIGPVAQRALRARITALFHTANLHPATWSGKASRIGAAFLEAADSPVDGWHAPGLN